ncbi:MAG: chitobiase/beta-hexosaminidase C-terminal domain-containing protein [Lachnospiraceae bacterium]|nr:chitobiase/beta-hexosaminidase C-terminal domain-containing protein [Lachnospiraceae bacterium]
MRCKQCGTLLPNDALICSRCGADVQVVPDYNPLDEMLARQVQGGIRDATRPIKPGEIKKYRNQKRLAHSTRMIQTDEMNRIRIERAQQRRQVEASGEADRQETEQIRRLKRSKRRARKKMQRLLIVLLIVVLVITGISLLVYHNSYRGVIGRAHTAMGSGQIDRAENLFRRAIRRTPSRVEAYVGLSNLLLQNEREDEVERMFLDALDGQGGNIELYEAMVQFYLEINQPLRISQLLNGADARILEALYQYVSSPPVFSLEAGEFTEVQELSLSTEHEAVIRFTVDGTDPTIHSPVYTDPLLLNEGEHVIQAISVNEMGIPSLMVSRTYWVELPIADAPAVSPSTGQYHRHTQISIQVPEGYTAYFTLDGSIPNPGSFNTSQYVEPIDMPVGRTIFSAIMVNNATGRQTAVTQRNYILELQ